VPVRALPKRKYYLYTILRLFSMWQEMNKSVVIPHPRRIFIKDTIKDRYLYKMSFIYFSQIS